MCRQATLRGCEKEEAAKFLTQGRAHAINTNATRRFTAWHGKDA